MAEMDRAGNFEMRIKRFAYWFVGLAIVVVIWKLSWIESGNNFSPMNHQIIIFYL